MAGRKRIHDKDCWRPSFKISNEEYESLGWYIDYLNAHNPDGKKFTMQDVLYSMFKEYRQRNATLVANAVEWVRKGRKPPKEE